MMTNSRRATRLALLALFFAGHAQVARAQQAIFVLRHAERVEYESADGVLSNAGEERAGALARVLADAGVTAIYTSERHRGHSRPQRQRAAVSQGARPYR
jgi:hypothetical protein